MTKHWLGFTLFIFGNWVFLKGQERFSSLAVGAYYIILPGVEYNENASWAHYINLEVKYELFKRTKAAGNVLLAYDTGSRKFQYAYSVAVDYDLAKDNHIGINLRLGFGLGNLNSTLVNKNEVNYIAGFSLDYRVHRRLRIQSGYYRYSPIREPAVVTLDHPFIGILISIGKMKML